MLAARTRTPPWEETARAILVLLLVVADGAARQHPEDATEIVEAGQRIRLDGTWTERETLWEDAALVLEGHDGLRVLEGGASSARSVEVTGEVLGPSPTWSHDSRWLFAWSGVDEGLVALDVETADVRLLRALPRHIANYEFREHWDPRPIRRYAVETRDGRTLLVLLQEESNAQVAFWQRSSNRTGGHWLEKIPLDGAERTTLTGEQPLPGRVLAWDVAPDRGLLFLITFEGEEGHRHLRTRRLDGTPVGTAIPTPSPCDLSVSPDERWLLIARDYQARPGDLAESLGRPEDRRWQRILGSSPGGFALLDLDSGEMHDGPPTGRSCSWSPDALAVVLCTDQELLLYSVESRESLRLATFGPTTAGSGIPRLGGSPRWSPRGRRLAVTHGGFDGPAATSRYVTLLLDLDEKEFLVLVREHAGFLWAPGPTPFASIGR